jgi:hypothetical protein
VLIKCTKTSTATRRFSTTGGKTRLGKPLEGRFEDRFRDGNTTVGNDLNTAILDANTQLPIRGRPLEDTYTIIGDRLNRMAHQARRPRDSFLAFPEKVARFY